MSILNSLPSHQWPPTVDEGLLLNVKKDNRWAVFVVPHSMANCLLRPGVLDYTGTASGWLDAAPLLAREQTGDKKGYRLSTRGRPVRAPIESGLMVLNYDAKTLLSCQDCSSSLEVSLQLWGFTTRNAAHPERQWLQALAQTGHLKQALWEDGRVDVLPVPPLDVLDTAKWWERELFAVRGLPNPESYPDAFSEHITFPLQPAGWSSMLEVNLERAVDVFEKLFPALREDEVEQWSQWAHTQQNDDVLSMLRRIKAAHDLELSLPAPVVSKASKPRM